MKNNSEYITPGIFISYSTYNNKKYIGKVIDVDRKKGIIYVWYGYGVLETATDINKVTPINISKENLSDFENNSLFEMISFNDYDEDYVCYFQALHNMINALNTEYKFTPVINELDYVLTLKDYVSFVKCINDLRNKLLEREARI